MAFLKGALQHLVCTEILSLQTNSICRMDDLAQVMHFNAWWFALLLFSSDVNVAFQQAAHKVLLDDDNLLPLLHLTVDYQGKDSKGQLRSQNTNVEIDAHFDVWDFFKANLKTVYLTRCSYHWMLTYLDVFFLYKSMIELLICHCHGTQCRKSMYCKVFFLLQKAKETRN